MIIGLTSWTNLDVMDLTSYAAKVCYTSILPTYGDRLNVKKQLFETGHHTTLEHFYLTYIIDGIAVGDVTFGLHLTHPFYNTDQRSGRYAGKMFSNPDYGHMKSYIEQFWPSLGDRQVYSVINYIKTGVEIYNENMGKAKEVVAGFIKEERPHASDGIRKNIPKYTQEQMRMFIPIIFPTALVYTIDVVTLVSMYESAWSPVMRHATGEMARLFVEKFPETKFLFDENRRRRGDWSGVLNECGDTEIKYKPELYSLSVTSDGYMNPGPQTMHPIDKLNFTPELMSNSIDSMKMVVEISVATMGQDQRHRTIQRGEPAFTCNFYLPPILKNLDLEKKAIDYMSKWKDIAQVVPETLAMILVPYGAMVNYDKRGSLNAIAHEQGKRLCWCAQEEIYHLGRLMRLSIENQYSDDLELLDIFQPPCYEDGKCSEGDRYCGRDISLRKTGDYFPERRV